MELSSAKGGGISGPLTSARGITVPVSADTLVEAEVSYRASERLVRAPSIITMRSFIHEATQQGSELDKTSMMGFE